MEIPLHDPFTDEEVLRSCSWMAMILSGTVLSWSCASSRFAMPLLAQVCRLGQWCPHLLLQWRGYSGRLRDFTQQCEGAHLTWVMLKKWIVIPGKTSSLDSINSGLMNLSRAAFPSHWHIALWVPIISTDFDIAFHTLGCVTDVSNYPKFCSSWNLDNFRTVHWEYDMKCA